MFAWLSRLFGRPARTPSTPAPAPAPAPAVPSGSIDGSPYRLGAVLEVESGRYTLIRELGPVQPGGAQEIEIWTKEGVDRSQYVYRRSQWADGSSVFYRMEPFY